MNFVDDDLTDSKILDVSRSALRVQEYGYQIWS